MFQFSAKFQVLSKFWEEKNFSVESQNGQLREVKNALTSIQRILAYMLMLNGYKISLLHKTTPGGHPSPQPHSTPQKNLILFIALWHFQETCVSFKSIKDNKRPRSCSLKLEHVSIVSFMHYHKIVYLQDWMMMVVVFKIHAYYSPALDIFHVNTRRPGL